MHVCYIVHTGRFMNDTYVCVYIYRDTYTCKCIYIYSEISASQWCVNVNGLAGIQIHGWNKLVDNLQVQDSSYKGSPLGMTLIAWWMVPIPIAQKTLPACVVSNHYNWKLNKGLVHMYRNTNMCIFVFFLCVHIYIFIYWHTCICICIIGCVGLFMLGFCQTDFGYQNYI